MVHPDKPSLFVGLENLTSHTLPVLERKAEITARTPILNKPTRRVSPRPLETNPLSRAKVHPKAARAAPDLTGKLGKDGKLTAPGATTSSVNSLCLLWETRTLAKESQGQAVAPARAAIAELPASLNECRQKN